MSARHYANGVYTAPVPYDLDNDGYDDLIFTQFTTNWRELEAVSPVKGRLTQWQAFVESRANSLAAGSLTKNGPVRVAGPDKQNSLRLFDENGNQIARYFAGGSMNDINWEMAPPVFADVNGDGIKEIIFLDSALMDRETDEVDSVQLFVLDQELNPLAGWPVILPNNVAYRFTPFQLSVADVDGDGDREIAIANDFQVYLYDHQGIQQSGFPRTFGYSYSPGYIHGIALVDLDQDKDLEVVVSSGNRVQNGVKILAYHHNGTNVAGFPIDQDFGVATSTFAVGDLNNDGRYEIVTGNAIGGLFTIFATTRAQADAYDSEGNQLAGWPVDAPLYYPVIGDIDGDGEAEVVAGGLDGRIYAFNYDGSAVDGFPYVVQGWQQPIQHVTLGDFDKDGDVDIAYHSPGLELAMLDLTAPYHEQTMYWPMYHKDAANTKAIEVEKNNTGDWQRTVIYIYGETVNGQDMFIRGGLDHDYAARNLGLNCTTTNYQCAIPIRHLNYQKQFSSDSKIRQEYFWQVGDNYLDWYGKESEQGWGADGSPLASTAPQAYAQRWNLPWYHDAGYGADPENTFGPHFWKLNIEMDCSRTVDGWFELKSYITNGPGWEGNVNQGFDNAEPYNTINHLGKCGQKNVFFRNWVEVSDRGWHGPNDVIIEDL